MLNNLKDWAIEKGDQSMGFAQGVANEVQTTGVMEWSTSVWLAIGGVVAVMILGAISR